MVKKLTWSEFNKKRMSAYMKKYGNHGAAIRQIAKEWNIYKLKFGSVKKKVATKTIKKKVIKKSIKKKVIKKSIKKKVATKTIKKKMSSATKKKMSSAMKKHYKKKK